MTYNKEEKCNQLFELVISHWNEDRQSCTIDERWRSDRVYIGLLTDIIVTCEDHNRDQ